MLQALTRAGLLEGVRGPAGGYRLGKPKRDIPVSDVIQAVADDNADEPSGTLQAAVVAPLWDELEGVLARHLATLTLADLLQRAAEQGIKPRPSEPLDFAI